MSKVYSKKKYYLCPEEENLKPYAEKHPYHSRHYPCELPDDCSQYLGGDYFLAQDTAKPCYFGY
ncbi:MAG: hypothetical protein Q3983_02100 [Capnocytophaga sp.]|nr:hypothetical protein [Capnocytophaga sp.]